MLPAVAAAAALVMAVVADVVADGPYTTAVAAAYASTATAGLAAFALEATTVAMPVNAAGDTADTCIYSAIRVEIPCRLRVHTRFNN